MTVPLNALRAAYGDLSALVLDLDEAASWRPTGCAGWAVRDLVQHLLGDAQRALVAFATPADRPAEALVVTQGHVLRADDLAATLVVEAAVHHPRRAVGERPAAGLGRRRVDPRRDRASRVQPGAPRVPRCRPGAAPAASVTGGYRTKVSSATATNTKAR